MIYDALSHSKLALKEGGVTIDHTRGSALTLPKNFLITAPLQQLTHQKRPVLRVGLDLAGINREALHSLHASVVSMGPGETLWMISKRRFFAQKALPTEKHSKFTCINETWKNPLGVILVLRPPFL